MTGPATSSIFFFHLILLLCEGKTGLFGLGSWQTHFWKWMRLVSHQEKDFIVFVASDKIWTVKYRICILENLFLPQEASQLHNSLLILVMIPTKVILWLFYNEIFVQYLEDPHNSGNLYFPNDKCMMLQNYICAKNMHSNKLKPWILM